MLLGNKYTYNTNKPVCKYIESIPLHNLELINIFAKLYSELILII